MGNGVPRLATGRSGKFNSTARSCCPMWLAALADIRVYIYAMAVR